MNELFRNTLGPAAWGAMIAVPIAIFALYFLKLKRQPLEVPSTYLWTKVIEDLHVNSLWQRLRQSLLLFLQLALVALAILALLRPGWEGESLTGAKFIFLVDKSASMSSTDVEAGNRLTAAKTRVAALIGGMVQAIRDDTAISEEQKELLQVASIPLYKILTVQAAYGRGMPTDDRETLAEIASVDLLFAVLDRIVSEAGRSMSSFIGADEAKIAMWQSQVNVVRQALADRQANTHLKVNAVLQIIEKTAFIENVLAASMSPGMAASLDWSRGVQSRALTH